MRSQPWMRSWSTRMRPPVRVVMGGALADAPGRVTPQGESALATWQARPIDYSEPMRTYLVALAAHVASFASTSVLCVAGANSSTEALRPRAMNSQQMRQRSQSSYVTEVQCSLVSNTIPAPNSSPGGASMDMREPHA